MLGRGTRPSPDSGKENCLVLDFAGNTRRLGPINDPVKPRKPGKGPAGEAPVRICENCGVYNHASARHCCNCGTEFLFETKIFATASNTELLRSDLPIVEYFPVSRVLYNLHEKEGAPPSIKVSYFCGFQMFNEWVCLEHKGMPAKKARDWWRQRHQSEPPDTTHEALRRVSELRVPAKVRVWTNKKYPKVLSYEY
jgi:DNA repair protein RadD